MRERSAANSAACPRTTAPTRARAASTKALSISAPSPTTRVSATCRSRARAATSPCRKTRCPGPANGCAIMEVFAGTKTSFQDPALKWIEGWPGQDLQPHQADVIGKAATVMKYAISRVGRPEAPHPRRSTCLAPTDPADVGPDAEAADGLRPRLLTVALGVKTVRRPLAARRSRSSADFRCLSREGGA